MLSQPDISCANDISFQNSCQAGATGLCCRLRALLEGLNAFAIPFACRSFVGSSGQPYCGFGRFGPRHLCHARAKRAFSGIVKVEPWVVQPDGSIVNFKTICNIARHSRGRIHTKSRELVRVTSSKTPEVISTHLYDPQIRTSTMLDPKERTFSTMTVNRLPVPPALAALTGSSLPQNDFTKEDDLGTYEMKGLAVHGVRQAQTIPLNGDTGKELVVTDEYWYSEDLRISLIIKHSDPLKETVTMPVAQVARKEPDPALFFPEGYTTPRAERGIRVQEPEGLVGSSE